MTITSPPKPIETEAFGRLFRSRLEARCAVFLEAMGLRWEYEPEGFELPSGRYLPDFKVYDANKLSGFYWLECKGGIPTNREVQLARELSKATKAAVAFFNCAIMDEIRSMYLLLLDITKSESFSEIPCTAAKFLQGPFFFANAETEKAAAGPAGLIQLWDRPSIIDSQILKLGFTTAKPWLLYIDALEPEWPIDKAFAAVNQALKARFEHGSRWL